MRSLKPYPFFCIFFLKKTPFVLHFFGENNTLSAQNIPFLLYFCPNTHPSFCIFLSKSHPWYWHTRGTGYIVSSPHRRENNMMLLSIQYIFIPRRHIWDSRGSGSGLLVPENSDFGMTTVKGNSDFGSDQSPCLAYLPVYWNLRPQSLKWTGFLMGQTPDHAFWV